MAAVGRIGRQLAGFGGSWLGGGLTLQVINTEYNLKAFPAIIIRITDPRTSALLFRTTQLSSVSVREPSKRAIEHALHSIRRPNQMLDSLVIPPMQSLWLHLWLRHFACTLSSGLASRLRMPGSAADCPNCVSEAVTRVLNASLARCPKILRRALVLGSDGDEYQVAMGLPTWARSQSQRGSHPPWDWVLTLALHCSLSLVLSLVFSPSL